MMIRDVNKNILLYFDYTMKKLVNICGNVQLNIMHSLGFVLLLKVHQRGKTFSEWDHGSDIGIFFKKHILILINNLRLKCLFQWQN